MKALSRAGFGAEVGSVLDGFIMNQGLTKVYHIRAAHCDHGKVLHWIKGSLSLCSPMKSCLSQDPFQELCGKTSPLCFSAVRWKRTCLNLHLQG